MLRSSRQKRPAAISLPFYPCLPLLTTIYPFQSSMKGSFAKYSHLKDEDSDSQKQPPHRRSQVIGLIFLILLASVLGVIVGSIRPLRLHIPSTSEPEISDCGHTSREARARGCVLEPMVRYRERKPTAYRTFIDPVSVGVRMDATSMPISRSDRPQTIRLKSGSGSRTKT